MNSDARSILDTDLAGVLTTSRFVLATIGEDGSIDEPAYRAATEQMTARGYQLPRARRVGRDPSASRSTTPMCRAC